jgi:LAS superfamily LD-carboxypeptidase LdcB
MFSELEITGRSRAHIVQFDAPRFAATEATAAAFLRMREAASADGIDLAPYASYRDFPAQLRIWNKKFSGDKILYDLNEQVRDFALLSEEDLVWAILNWHSLPGASRRHWGTDIDVIDRAVMAPGYKPSLLPSEAREGAVFHSLHYWLDRHMHEHGFFRPYQHLTGGMYPEPWHLSYAMQSLPASRLLSFELLARVIEGSEILGKQTILKLLPDIFARHVLNVAAPPAPGEIVNFCEPPAQSNARP